MFMILLSVDKSFICLNSAIKYNTIDSDTSKIKTPIFTTFQENLLRFLPNANFAFTRASLIACTPLVALAIFLQKFSSSLLDISARRITDVRNRKDSCRAFVESSCLTSS